MQMIRFVLRKETFALVFIAALLQSCSFKELDIKSTENFSVDQFSQDGIILGVDATIYNPNNFSIKVKDIHLDVYVKNDFIGTTELVKTVKIKAKKTKSYHFKVTTKKGTLNKKVFPKLMLMAATKSSLPVTFKGYIKGKVFIFSKKIPVEFKDKIDL